MKEIKLPKGKVAMVDDEDFEELNKYKWCAFKGNSTYYVSRATRVAKKQKVLLMHRVIMKTPKGMHTDHINGDGLDNQRSNLRIATHSENMRNTRMSKNNTSGYKGVCWDKNAKKWHVQITVDSKLIYLGLYDTVEDGYKAYCIACIKYHGEFANLGQSIK